MNDTDHIGPIHSRRDWASNGTLWTAEVHSEPVAIQRVQHLTMLMNCDAEY